MRQQEEMLYGNPHAIFITVKSVIIHTFHQRSSLRFTAALTRAYTHSYPVPHEPIPRTFIFRSDPF